MALGAFTYLFFSLLPDIVALVAYQPALQPISIHIRAQHYKLTFTVPMFSVGDFILFVYRDVCSSVIRSPCKVVCAKQKYTGVV